jgi:hypothetical protein
MVCCRAPSRRLRASPCPSADVMSWPSPTPSRGSIDIVWPTAPAVGPDLLEAVRATAWRQKLSTSRSQLFRPGLGLGVEIRCPLPTAHRRGPHSIVRRLTDSTHRGGSIQRLGRLRRRTPHGLLSPFTRSRRSGYRCSGRSSTLLEQAFEAAHKAGGTFFRRGRGWRCGGRGRWIGQGEGRRLIRGRRNGGTGRGLLGRAGGGCRPGQQQRRGVGRRRGWRRWHASAGRRGGSREWFRRRRLRLGLPRSGRRRLRDRRAALLAELSPEVQRPFAESAEDGARPHDGPLESSLQFFFVDFRLVIPDAGTNQRPHGMVAGSNDGRGRNPERHGGRRLLQGRRRSGHAAGRGGGRYGGTGGCKRCAALETEAHPSRNVRSAMGTNRHRRARIRSGSGTISSTHLITGGDTSQASRSHYLYSRWGGCLGLT